MSNKKSGLTADGKLKPQKADLLTNGTFDLTHLKSKDEGKVMLRIDKNTVILVTPEKCNEEYAALYRERM